jgi:hypothetical protein
MAGTPHALAHAMTTRPPPSRDAPAPEPIDDPLRGPPAEDQSPVEAPVGDPRPKTPKVEDPPPPKEPDDSEEPHIEDPPLPEHPEGDKAIT